LVPDEVAAAPDRGRRRLRARRGVHRAEPPPGPGPGTARGLKRRSNLVRRRRTRFAGLTELRFGSMRVCLVTPFAWSQPHDVNDHVGGVAKGLRDLGHEVTVIAPSTRGADLLAGRPALTRGARSDVIA